MIGQIRYGYKAQYVFDAVNEILQPENWRHEIVSKEIFDFLHEERIEGVVLISGDRHRSDAWKIQREEGYDLYEFESARLTNIHTHGLMPEAIFGYNEKNSFGILHFDTTQADPVVTYKIYNIENELINQLTLKRSQLEY